MAKKKPKRMWVYSPGKPTPPPVPDDIRTEVEFKAKELVETHLRPNFTNPPPKGHDERRVSGPTTIETCFTPEGTR